MKLLISGDLGPDIVGERGPSKVGRGDKGVGVDDSGRVYSVGGGDETYPKPEASVLDTG